MQKSLSIIAILTIGFLTSCTNPFESTPVTTPPVSVATGVVISIPAIVPLTPFIAKGTEPFWALEQTATGVRFSEPSATGVTEVWYTSVQTNVGASISIVGTPVTTGLPLGAILTPGTCSDGMSDIIYAYTAIITLGTGTLSGCAN